MNTCIDIKNLNFSYTHNNVLSNINLKILKGEFITLIGRNGVGKSTLLKLISGFLRPDTGEIIIDNIKSTNDNFWDIKKKIGIIFQNPDNQIIGLTVKEELSFGLRNLGFSETEIEKKIKVCISEFNLNENINNNTMVLSGGEKQKLSIASTLIMEPDIVLLDEVTSMLDPYEKIEIFEIINSYCKKNKSTIINVTQDKSQILKGSRIIVLDNGSIAFDDTLSNLSIDINHKNWIRKTSLSDKIYYNTSITPLQVKITNLSYNVKINSSNLKSILNNISFDIKKGEFILILGRNGSGKTTLVNHIRGAVLNQDGKIEFEKHILSKKTQSIYKKHIGIVFQNPEYQFVCDNVYDDISFSLRKLKINGKDIKKEIHKILLQLNIPDNLLSKSVFNLSDGDKKKVAIAGVLVGNPDILIFDEPLSGMDFIEKESFSKVLLNLKLNLKKTVIIISHDIEGIIQYIDKIALLDNGKLVCFDKPDVLFKNKLLTDYQKEFI